MENLTKEQLNKLSREAKNKYHKEWRDKNPDKVKKHQADYWERQARKQLKIQGNNIA